MSSPWRSRPGPGSGVRLSRFGSSVVGSSVVGRSGDEDVEFEVDTEFHWSWKDEPRKFEWERGDFIFVPAYCIQQHFNSDSKNEARLIVITNRIFKAMGLNWLEQVENAPDYEGDLEPMLAGPGWTPDTRKD